MAELAKSTLIEDTWLNFRDRIADQVTSVSISISPNTVTVQSYASTFSDNDFSSKSDFPVVVIETPRYDTEYFTMGITKANGMIDIEVYTTQSQSADKFLSKIIDAIETYRGTLRGFGIRMVELESTESDMVERGQMKIHMRRARFKFEYHYSRTRSY